MTDKESSPGLEKALDGLIAAGKYCDENGHEDLSSEINRVYQALGKRELGQPDEENQ